MSIKIDSVQYFSGPRIRDQRTVITVPSTYAPVYEELDKALLAESHPDDIVRHVLAVCAGYTYSDTSTLSTMMNRLGLEDARCVAVPMTVDAMFIRSTAYVIQSGDGKVVIVSYRGTEPANVINWLTDADVDTELVPYLPSDASGGERHAVHAGFYRNVRATRFAVVDLLRRALHGQSIGPSNESEAVRPAEAIYLTGHSLGGAMATLLTIMLHENSKYADIAPHIRATYTYGQPMVATKELADACAAKPFANSVFRYIHRADLVPHLPPRESGEFKHFGREFQCDRHSRQVCPAGRVGQTGGIGIVIGLAAMVTGVFELLRLIPLPYSLADHGPHHYITALTPADKRSEFGE